MKLLIMTSPVYPMAGNNANLISKLIRPLQESGHDVRLFAYCPGHRESLPESVFGVPVFWEKDDQRDFKRKILIPLLSKVFDRNGYSDLIMDLVFLRTLKRIKKTFPFDAVIVTTEPYSMASAAARLSCSRILYIMDPPECINGGESTPFRSRRFPQIARDFHLILATPFTRDALIKCGYQECIGNVAAVGFPMIGNHQNQALCSHTATSGKIRLLFTGWMCSDIRSPKYFLDIVSRLDERFEVTFMGKECEKLQERFPTKSKATLITLPNQPYDVALQAMADADVLINIGNNVRVHMPSKTLEYINTGKPMVNFYKFADCPTLYYTKRYPLALNLYEEEKDMDAAAARFVRFCEETVGKTVDHDWIETEFADCTPKYIAQKILESLEKSHG